MISRAAIFSSSIARQTLMRSAAAGSSSTCSPSRAMRTSFSTVSDEPSRVMVTGVSPLAGLRRRAGGRRAAGAADADSRATVGEAGLDAQTRGLCPGLRTQMREPADPNRPDRRTGAPACCLLARAGVPCARLRLHRSRRTRRPAGRQGDRPMSDRQTAVMPKVHRLHPGTGRAPVRPHARQHQLRLPRPVGRSPRRARASRPGAPLHSIVRAAGCAHRADSRGASQGDSTWEIR